MASYSKEFTATALGRSDDSLPDEGGARSEGVDGVFDAVSLSAAGAVSFLEGGDSVGEVEAEEFPLLLLGSH